MRALLALFWSELLACTYIAPALGYFKRTRVFFDKKHTSKYLGNFKGCGSVIKDVLLLGSLVLLIIFSQVVGLLENVRGRKAMKNIYVCV